MDSTDNIPIVKTSFGTRERELINDVLNSGWIVQGPHVADFERGFSEYTSLAYCNAVSNCTAGLHTILAALGVGKGDEVIVPSFTYIATANAVEYVGAKPVFCDIDLSTFNMSVKNVESKITKKTRAIIAVSLFGLCSVTNDLFFLADSKKVSLIEDAACALGSYIDGQHAGHRAIASAFSFHPRKAITTGEGGMIATRDSGLAELVSKLRNHGAESTDLQRHQKANGSLLPEFNILGFNYRMTDIQGAIGKAQLERFPKILESRRAAASKYGELLGEHHSVIAPNEPSNCKHSYQSYVVIFRGTLTRTPVLEDLAVLNSERNALMAQMQESGIGVRQGTHAVHSLGYYRRKYGLSPEELPSSLISEQLSITLPIFDGITFEQQERVVAFFKRTK